MRAVQVAGALEPAVLVPGVHPGGGRRSNHLCVPLRRLPQVLANIRWRGRGSAVSERSFLLSVLLLAVPTLGYDVKPRAGLPPPRPGASSNRAMHHQR